MRLWKRNLALLLLLGSACKRQDLELTDTNGIVLPGSSDITSARSIEEERQANAKRQAELDETIASLTASLSNSQNLSTEQKADLEQKMTAAQAEKAHLSSREKELINQLAETQKALEEARKRNEELNKELENSRNTTRSVGTDNQPTANERAVLGPFTMFKADQCIEVANKSFDENATLTMNKCSAAAANQQFTFVEMDGDGAYSIVAGHSQKCLKVAGSSEALGAKLVQATCVEDDKSQQFWVLALNDEDFLLQNTKSEYCFSLQGDKSLTQVVCDSKSNTALQMDIATP